MHDIAPYIALGLAVAGWIYALSKRAGKVDEKTKNLPETIIDVRDKLAVLNSTTSVIAEKIKALDITNIDFKSKLECVATKLDLDLLRAFVSDSMVKADAERRVLLSNIKDTEIKINNVENKLHWLIGTLNKNPLGDK